MVRTRELPQWLTGPIVAIAVGVIIWRELRTPLRHGRAESRLVRDARNLSIAGLAGVVVQFVEVPVARFACHAVDARGWGILPRLQFPRWLEITVAIALLDYTLYIWHVATHKVPVLWRFHAAHHADLDMDASTAFRFHFGELLISVLWRVAQLAIIGVTPLAFSIWQSLVLVSIAFHHSNWRLPLVFERALSAVIVTPRMHNIHHSTLIGEMDSNWSSGLSIWDRMHGTFAFWEPEDCVSLGLAHKRRPADVSLLKVLGLPFTATADELQQRR